MAIRLLRLKMEIVSCAMRGRPDGKRNKQNLELNADIANAITSVQKDSLVCEIYEYGQSDSGAEHCG